MPLSQQELESKLWGAADILRGQIDAADYKNYIFAALFLKRLSDRFEEEVEAAVASRRATGGGAGGRGRARILRAGIGTVV